VNFSDQVPLCLHINVDEVNSKTLSPNYACLEQTQNKLDWRLRWDKAVLSDYYAMTYRLLSTICVPSIVWSPCSEGIAAPVIENVYRQITDALHAAATSTVPSKDLTTVSIGGTIS
jgi:hypothetical protein